MKKVINITAYILSVIFILTSIIGIIYFVKLRNDKPGEKDLPTIAYIQDEFDIPVMEINGNTDGISKENKVNVYVKYHSDELNFNTNATIKWQGLLLFTTIKKITILALWMKMEIKTKLK